MTTVNHECYVSLEVSKLLKEAGFDWECRCYYETSGKLRGKNSGSFSNHNSPLIWQNNGNTNTQLYSAPTLAVAQRWLREEKLYDVLVDTGGYKNYEYFINYHGVKEGPNYPFHEYNHNLICNTYEEALEAGIKKALEIILEK